MSGIAMVRTLLVAASLSVVTAGCGSGSAPSTAPSTVTVTVTPTPTASASSTTGTTGTAGHAETDLSDGRHPVRIATVDAAHRQITVDVVQFFRVRSFGLVLRIQ